MAPWSWRPAARARGHGLAVVQSGRSRPGAGRVPQAWQSQRGARHQAVDMDVVHVRVKTEPGEAVEDLLEGHPQLHPGEMDTQADMRPLPEGQVRLHRAEQVELVGVFPP